MMTTRSSSSFGARIQDGGTVFSLWAPAARTVDLVIDGSAPQEMAQKENGFFELFVAGCAAGTRYKYRINGETLVPDPASRFQPDDVDGSSEVIDFDAFVWRTQNWIGRPWVESVIYELHVGTFTPEGTYRAVIEKLDGLVELGITAIELMPLAEAPGHRNWGYDGVQLYSPERVYGRPEDLQALVDAAHDRGLQIFLDVVYNHFGPQGNYLNVYAPEFFTERYHTPWGAAIHLSGPSQEPVRRFFIENAVEWLEAYKFDGLRFDAAHELRDHRIPGFLDDLASTIKLRFKHEREVHLILENDDNNVRLLSGYRETDNLRFDAQWNDDIHHALHVVATGEGYDYYADYAADPVGKLMRGMSDGFIYQGEWSDIRGRNRGGPSGGLPKTSFVVFLQNHDQVGNRAMGERLGMLTRSRAVQTLSAMIYLSPMIPMMFMGDEWNSTSPFLYFCNFEGELSKLVREGRRRDFKGFPDFADESDLKQIPDPGDIKTFERSKLNWAEREEPEHQAWVAFFRDLLAIRRREIVPRLRGNGPHAGSARRISDRAFSLSYWLGDGSMLHMTMNFAETPVSGVPQVTGRMLYATDSGTGAELGPWGIRVHLDVAASAS